MHGAPPHHLTAAATAARRRRRAHPLAAAAVRRDGKAVWRPWRRQARRHGGAAGGGGGSQRKTRRRLPARWRLPPVAAAQHHQQRGGHPRRGGECREGSCTGGSQPLVGTGCDRLTACRLLAALPSQEEATRIFVTQALADWQPGTWAMRDDGARQQAAAGRFTRRHAAACPWLTPASSACREPMQPPTHAGSVHTQWNAWGGFIQFNGRQETGQRADTRLAGVNGTVDRLATRIPVSRAGAAPGPARPPPPAGGTSCCCMSHAA